MVFITVRGYGRRLGGTGESERPGGGMGRLGGGPQFLEGQSLAVISERVLLQLADGHRGEGARQAFISMLLTWEEEKKQRSSVSASTTSRKQFHSRSYMCKVIPHDNPDHPYGIYLCVLCEGGSLSDSRRLI